MSDPIFAIKNLKNYSNAISEYIQNSKNNFPVNLEKTIKELSKVSTTIEHFRPTTFYNKKPTKITDLLALFKEKINKFLISIQEGEEKKPEEFEELYKDYIKMLKNMEEEAKKLGLNLD